MRQELGHVVDTANTAADRERNEDLVGRTRDRIEKDGPMLRGSRDVEKDDLVRPLAVIEGSQLRRVACIAQVLEANALDDATVIDVEAGDYSLCGHGSISRRGPRSFRTRAGRQVRSSRDGTEIGRAHV